jgi:hypothetical protein
MPVMGILKDPDTLFGVGVAAVAVMVATGKLMERTWLRYH